MKFIQPTNPGGGGAGTVTSFNFTDGSGFDGTVTNSTTTPTLSLTTSLTTGSVPFIGASGALSEDNTNLKWDNTQKMLLVNGGSGFGRVDVAGADSGRTTSDILFRGFNSSTYNTTAGARISYGGLINVSSTRSAGANTLTNIGLSLDVSGGQVNYALSTSSGQIRLGDLAGTGTRMVVAGATGILSTQTIPAGTIGGTITANQVAYGTGADTIGGNSGFQYIASTGELTSTFSSTGATADSKIIWGQATGTMDATAASRTSYSGYFNSNRTRSAGANDVINVGVYGNASGGQKNYAGFFEGQTVVNTGVANSFNLDIKPGSYNSLSNSATNQIIFQQNFSTNDTLLRSATVTIQDTSATTVGNWDLDNATITFLSDSGRGLALFDAAANFGSYLSAGGVTADEVGLYETDLDTVLASYNITNTIYYYANKTLLYDAGNRVSIMGDASAANNGTTISVDDISQKTTITKGFVTDVKTLEYGTTTTIGQDYYHVAYHTSTGAATANVDNANIAIGTTLIFSDVDGIASTSNITIDVGTGNTIKTPAGSSQTYAIAADFESVTIQKVLSDTWMMVSKTQ